VRGECVADSREHSGPILSLGWRHKRAVLTSHPFCGEGLSGTGPKAGGPYYLHRFCAEQTVTVNTAAAGGNVALLA
jgi:delta 1-pyrroline-5-carboxylate dehydrogenase